jgi:hypothetical protein
MCLTWWQVVWAAAFGMFLMKVLDGVLMGILKGLMKSE